MKKIIVSTAFFAIIALTSFGQPKSDLPAATALIHYKLPVGYHATTVLIFPSPVLQADRGEKDLMAQKQPGVENVLKVKAARRDFLPTNLHVFTADGRVYAFDVVNVPEAAQTTYDLTRLTIEDSLNSNSMVKIELSSKPLDRQKLIIDLARVKDARTFISSQYRKLSIKIQLQKIYRSNDILFFGFNVINKSDLPYVVDYTRLYIQDKKNIKRSSIQQHEIVPIFSNLANTIAGNSSLQWIAAVPIFSLPEHSILRLEVVEKNGGRHLLLHIKSRILLKVRNIANAE